MNRWPAWYRERAIHDTTARADRMAAAVHNERSCVGRIPMTQSTWVAWIRAHRDALVKPGTGVLGALLGAMFFIFILQTDVTRLWLDRLFAETGVVTTATVVSVMSEPVSRRFPSSTVVVTYRAGRTPGVQVERGRALRASLPRPASARGHDAVGSVSSRPSDGGAPGGGRARWDGAQSLPRRQ